MIAIIIFAVIEAAVVFLIVGAVVVLHNDWKGL